MTPTALDTAVLAGLCDDASIFPPGRLPLDRAVAAHLAHRDAPHSTLVGPLVVRTADLPALARLTADRPAGSVDLSVTVPSPAAVQDASAEARRIRATRFAALEVVVPEALHVAAVVPMLEEGIGDPEGVTVFVEVPRDHRRDDLFAELAGSPYLAKLRTGGVRADLYPSESELAAAIASAVRHGVPFKATAGLHHAVRNTDPATGFEQHGFLNLLVATHAALAGAGPTELTALLAERDGSRLAELVRAVSPSTRKVFRSFGTCHIGEPVTELADLGLLDRELVLGLS